MGEYDVIAEQFSSPKREDQPLWNKMYAVVGRMVGGSPSLSDCSAVVADFGCGSGRFGKELIDTGKVNLVVGFDGSAEMLRIGVERRIPGLSFVQQDIFEKIPEQWCRGIFRFVTAYNVIQCASSEDQLRTFFQNVQSLLNVSVGKLENTVQFVAVLIHPGHPIPEVQAVSTWIDCAMVDGSRIHTTLYGVDGGEICSFQNYYWRKETLERIAQSAGLGNLCWQCPSEFDGTSLIIFSGGRIS
ncbi:MAG: class I SAM-dependent methyltransferase [Candidatus Moraniibacteriota bacterium]|nr:MAG: class I SAM-dependent methyltransferase [Candidatus Moranbacteria bacterium]